MTQIRLAILARGFVLACSALSACSALFGCSTADDGAAADGAGTGGAESSGARGAQGAVPGLPGLDAPADVAAPPADAEVRQSGLASKRLLAGTGSRSPRATDTVRVHYSGWQTNGVRFDSSVASGKPIDFPLNRVIAGWTEGLQLMVEGEERRFWIPEALAYQGRQAPYGTLVFDVQLIAILP
jgi:peptidylprolyl isomerase